MNRPSDRIWILMSFASVVTLALLSLWNLSLMATIRRQHEDIQTLGGQVIRDGDTLKKQDELIVEQQKFINEQQKLITVKTKLLDAYKKVDLLKQP